MAKFNFLVFFLMVYVCINVVRGEESAQKDTISILPKTTTFPPTTSPSPTPQPPTNPSSESIWQWELANSINALGSDLLSNLLKDLSAEDNLLVSPLNAYVALGMLHLAAGEKTKKELESVMKLNLPADSEFYHGNLKNVLKKLTAQPEGALGNFHDVALANGIFIQEEFPILDSYKSLASKYYNSEIRNLDFVKKADESTNIINNWIANSTKGRIAKFYETPLESDTVSVLTSALYFNGKWKKSFAPLNTQKEKFNTGKQEIETPMMNIKTDLHYTKDNDLHYDSVTLPYAGGDYEMTIYLQHENHGDHGSLADLYHKLAQKNFTDEKAEHLSVELKLPKMKFSWKKSLAQALQLEKIFAEADLSAMTAQKVRVSKMTHATDLEVDEKGTIATAATAIEMVLYSLYIPPNAEPIKFHVNRPFLMTIKHKPTNVVLFSGIIRKPM